MTDSMDEMKQRADVGNQILEKNKAQGEPGEKQPAHEDNRITAQDTVEHIDSMLKKMDREPIQPSSKRSQTSGNDYPVKPEDRSLAQQQNTQQLDAAAGHLEAARTALTTQATADAALTSDPRYERDLKVLELGQQGKLSQVPPSEFEKASRIPESEQAALEAAPDNAKEQAEEDMERLKEAENNGGTSSETGSTETGTTIK